MSDVWVLDASALFHIKGFVRADRQWELFEHLKVMVLAGGVAVPQQVIAEARNARHHDGPEIWLLGIAPDLQHPRQCSIVNHARVMNTVGSRLLDVDAEGDPADPYVIALALDLIGDGHRAVVVTDDHIDRPPRISLTGACREIGVPVCDLVAFLAAIGRAEDPADAPPSSRDL